MMMRRLSVAALCWFSMFAAADPAPAPDPACRPYHVVDVAYDGPHRFDSGLLWKVSRSGAPDSYLFGTIHVADESITTLPDPVSEAFARADSFIMEVLPDPDQIVLLSSMMFFGDGRRLNDMVPAGIFAGAAGILEAYHLPEQAVSAMKPWAAFLTMSYPPDMRTVLDIELLHMAQERGMAVSGLETLEEQGNVFDRMNLDDQITLLVDATCHYKEALQDFEKMKSLYLARDLRRLYEYGQRYEFADNSVYERLMRRLLTDRNRVMVQRMMPALERGGSFVAIGAMHLPGRDGVLSLLDSRHYRIEKLY